MLKCVEGRGPRGAGLAAWLQLRSREEGMAHPLASLQESIYGGCRVYIMHDECLSLNLVQPGRHLISSAQLGCCGPILGSIPPGTILSLSLSLVGSLSHPSTSYTASTRCTHPARVGPDPDEASTDPCVLRVGQ